MFVIFCPFGLALRPHLTPENVTSIGGCASIVPGLTTTLRNSSKHLWNHKTTHRFSCDSNVQCLFFFFSSEDILNWIGYQVDETNTFSICVSRTDLYNRGMQQWQRQKKTSPKCRLKVTFFAEAGIDTGALTKEFLTGTGVCPYLLNQTHICQQGASGGAMGSNADWMKKWTLKRPFEFHVLVVFQKCW